MEILLATTLRALMRRRTWMSFRHVLSEDSFRNSNAATIYLLLMELHGKNKRNVTEHTLRVAMEASTKQANRRKELNRVIDSIMEVDKHELDDADHAIRKYAAAGYAQQATQLWLTHGDDPSFDYADCSRLMGRAHTVMQTDTGTVLTAREVGLPGDDDMVRRAIPLGFSPELDASLLGGAGNGELIVMLAPPKRGKTSYLIRAATNAVLQGEHVLYFTLEIARRKVFLRYFQSLTNLTYTEMLSQRQLVSTRRAQTKGELHVLDYSMGVLTPNIIQAQAEQMMEDGVPLSYVVVDYMELMGPTHGWGRSGVNSRALGDMVKDVRRVAVSLDLPLLSAWQINRGGTDKYVFTTTDISESWEVVKHADILLGLNQGPQELAMNTMRIKVMEQRESPERPLIYLTSDMTRNNIRPFEGSPEGGNAPETGKKVDVGNRPRTRVHRSGSAG